MDDESLLIKCKYFSYVQGSFTLSKAAGVVLSSSQISSLLYGLGSKVSETRVIISGRDFPSTFCKSPSRRYSFHTRPEIICGK